MFKVWSVEDVKRAAHFPLFRGQLQRMVLVNKKKSLILRAANQSVGWDLNHCQWKESMFIITEIPRAHN